MDNTIDYSSLCWEDLWMAYTEAKEESDEFEAIEMELERRRDLYR